MVKVASVASRVPLSSIAPRVVTFTPTISRAFASPLSRAASSRATSTSSPSTLPVSGFWKPKPGTSIFVPTRSTSPAGAQPESGSTALPRAAPTAAAPASRTKERRVRQAPPGAAAPLIPIFSSARIATSIVHLLTVFWRETPARARWNRGRRGRPACPHPPRVRFP